MAKYVMAFDAGTTSNRCILFDEHGEICSLAQKEFTQYFPKPGWVEHDADEIWATQLSVAVEAMAKIGAAAKDIAAIGITNQRETTIVWDKKIPRQRQPCGQQPHPLRRVRASSPKGRAPDEGKALPRAPPLGELALRSND